MYEGWSSSQFSPRPDIVIIGNAMSRGNEAVEFVLNEGLDYESGPAWLAHHVLRERWVLAVAGTHGKTTTTSLLAWMPDWSKKDADRVGQGRLGSLYKRLMAKVD